MTAEAAHPPAASPIRAGEDDLAHFFDVHALSSATADNLDADGAHFPSEDSASTFMSCFESLSSIESDRTTKLKRAKEEAAARSEVARATARTSDDADGADAWDSCSYTAWDSCSESSYADSEWDSSEDRDKARLEEDLNDWTVKVSRGARSVRSFGSRMTFDVSFDGADDAKSRYSYIASPEVCGEDKSRTQKKMRQRRREVAENSHRLRQEHQNQTLQEILREKREKPPRPIAAVSDVKESDNKCSTDDRAAESMKGYKEHKGENFPKSNIEENAPKLAVTALKKKREKGESQITDDTHVAKRMKFENVANEEQRLAKDKNLSIDQTNISLQENNPMVHFLDKSINIPPFPSLIPVKPVDGTCGNKSTSQNIQALTSPVEKVSATGGMPVTENAQREDQETSSPPGDDLKENLASLSSTAVSHRLETAASADTPAGDARPPLSQETVSKMDDIFRTEAVDTGKGSRQNPIPPPEVITSDTVNEVSNEKEEDKDENETASLQAQDSNTCQTNTLTASESPVASDILEGNESTTFPPILAVASSSTGPGNMLNLAVDKVKEDSQDESMLGNEADKGKNLDMLVTTDVSMEEKEEGGIRDDIDVVSNNYEMQFI
uniref:Uncharacterized protein n=1 Tax=Corethron hystrix TaxID=216773 RepID=A0A7S1BKC8_9STRA|mmetsp:Transcript_31874/g.73360  ORF Transcript_31874/g.73360 Transcript_31874/m.73360 type:complete len:613 (+) Transcript_31874:122-1960(+)